MAITQSATVPSTRGCQLSTGAYLDTAVAADATITIGHTPKYVCVINATDRIKIEWWNGMASDTCIKTAANGTVTLETTNKGIVVGTGTFKISSNATLAVLVNSKQLYWTAMS